MHGRCASSKVEGKREAATGAPWPRSGRVWKRRGALGTGHGVCVPQWAGMPMKWTSPADSSNSIAPTGVGVHTPTVPSARKLTYTVVLEEDPPKHWHAYAPAVPGCFGGGRTRAEALRQYRAALRLHLDELGARGGSLPIERRSPAVQVIVAA
jgi:predicted RNase H-like HicB family nuclease